MINLSTFSFDKYSEEQYINCLEYILDKGHFKKVYSPAPTIPTIYKNEYIETATESHGILSVFGITFRYDCSKTIPIYTSKKTHWKMALKEMLWFYKDKGNVSKLHQQKCPIWNGWAYKQYIKDHKDRLSKSYLDSYEQFIKEVLEQKDFYIQIPYTEGTNFDGCDQTKWMIDEIQKKPERKSYVVSHWNPTRLYEQTFTSGKESVMIAACHNFYQLVVHNNKLNMHLNIRSNDMGLGHPFNICQYALLLNMYSHCTKIPVGELFISIGDCHIYLNQENSITELINNVKFSEFPTLKIKDRNQKYITDFEVDDFEINGYVSEEYLPIPLTVVGGF